MDVEPGSHRVRLCTGLCCRVTGAIDHLRTLEDRLGITSGQTTPDGRVTLEEASCLSLCSLAPVIEVDGVGHGRVTSADIDRLPKWFRTRPLSPVHADASRFPRLEAVGATARERLASLRSQAEVRARTRPTWRFLVQGGSCGEALGAGETLKALRILAAMRGLDAEVLDGACHGLCAAGIVVEVQRAGWPALTFTHLSTDTVPDFLSALERDRPPLTRFAGVAWNREGWQGLPPVSRHPFFARQRRVIMERCGHLHPVSLDDAILADGYAALADVLDRGAVEETVENVAPLVVSEETGAGLFADRHLLDGDPHRVLEGLVMAAHEARANVGIIEIADRARVTQERMARVLAKAQAAGLIGDHILGSPFSLHVEIRPGSTPFCDRQRVSSVAALTALSPLHLGGTSVPRSATRLCCVSGTVDRPGIVEVEETVTLRELLSDIGGLENGGDPGSVLLVGPSRASLRPETVDVSLGLLAPFSTGTGGVIALPDDPAAP